MPRKSKVDHLTELFGGTWTFNRHTSDRWDSDDGRTCFRILICTCWAKPWMIGKPCDCIPTFKLDDGTPVVFDDPRIYWKNGTSTKKRGL